MSIASKFQIYQWRRHPGSSGLIEVRPPAREPRASQELSAVADKPSARSRAAHPGSGRIPQSAMMVLGMAALRRRYSLSGLSAKALKRFSHTPARRPMRGESTTLLAKRIRARIRTRSGKDAAAPLRKVVKPFSRLQMERRLWRGLRSFRRRPLLVSFPP